MQNAWYHHANILAAQQRTDLQRQGTEMLAMMQMMAFEDNNLLNEDLHPSPAQPAANAVVQDSVQQKILRLLRDISASGRIGRGDQGRRDREGRRAGRAGRGKASRNCNRRTLDNAKFARKIINLYCWTHGRYNHISNDCTRKAQGHMDDATMDNYLAGFKVFF